MTKGKMSKAWFEVCQRVASVHGAPLPKLVLEIGDKTEGWFVRLNASDTPLDGVPPFEAVVMHNGSYCGSLGPHDGVFLGSGGEAERDLIEWLVSAEGRDA